MKMSRDLAVFRRRIVVVSAVLVALSTAACMTLLAVPLINADMTMRSIRSRSSQTSRLTSSGPVRVLRLMGRQV